jgi:hypothetical protein
MVPSDPTTTQREDVGQSTALRFWVVNGGKTKDHVTPRSVDRAINPWLPAATQSELERLMTLMGAVPTSSTCCTLDGDQLEPSGV